MAMLPLSEGISVVSSIGATLDFLEPLHVSPSSLASQPPIPPMRLLVNHSLHQSPLALLVLGADL
jgi:hypothetical protein